jgi:anti-sigma regulatory factor (Ser/Thr protein kinase)
MTTMQVPATLDSLAPVAAAVITAAGAAGLSRQAAYRLRLAVDELAANVIAYGYAGAAPGSIDLRIETDEKTLTVILEDAGVHFDPSRVPPPDDLHLPPEQRNLGGLGIFLARQGVDSFCYERVGGRNRNVLVVNRPPAVAVQSHVSPCSNA